MFLECWTPYSFIFPQVLLAFISFAEREFPKDFLFGAATSAYQIEGAWNADGKGPSVWDVGLHRDPSQIPDSSNGDVACNSYYFFDKDLEVMKELGMNVYRFSMSWSRILPNGDISSLNQAGVDYYNMVLNKLRANNIKSIVTMLHLDFPEEIQKIGGAISFEFVDYFANYADILYQLFGDRVDYWIPVNEPHAFCVGAYGRGEFPPNINASDIGGEYLCGHNVLKAHTRAYKIYKQRYSSKFSGKVGSSSIYIVTYKKIGDHLAIDNRATEYNVGWFSHPLLTKEGDYPEVMRREIAEHSKLEGRAWSRLPKFSTEWIELMKGSADFLAINYYSSQIGVPMNKTYNKKNPSFTQDIGLDTFPVTNSSKTSCWVMPYPKGLRDLLVWIKDNYDNIETIIAENGFCNEGSLDDDDRVEYIKAHLEEVLNAIYEDKCNVTSYNYWSMMDGFEFLAGFSQRFGLYEVNFNSTEKTRTMKKSGAFYRDIAKNRQL